LFFPSHSPHATCNARRLSNVLGRALRVATRCAFLFFFAKERKEAASAQSACALCSCHMRTARVASGTRAQRGKEGMQGERSESCLLRKSKERKKKGEERRGEGEGLRAARRASHMRTARVSSGTRAQRGKEGMQV
jgi:hypothetical protein